MAKSATELATEITVAAISTGDIRLTKEVVGEKEVVSPESTVEYFMGIFKAVLKAVTEELEAGGPNLGVGARL